MPSHITFWGIRTQIILLSWQNHAKTLKYKLGFYWKFYLLLIFFFHLSHYRDVSTASISIPVLLSLETRHSLVNIGCLALKGLHRIIPCNMKLNCILVNSSLRFRQDTICDVLLTFVFMFFWETHSIWLVLAK